MTPKRYLVYKQTNGQIYPQLFNYKPPSKSLECEFGEKLSELEILDHTLTLEQVVTMYPYGQEVIRR